jgi:hypothetical protein
MGRLTQLVLFISLVLFSAYVLKMGGVIRREGFDETTEEGLAWWAISLIVMAVLAVVGGLYYLWKSRTPTYNAAAYNNRGNAAAY